MRNTDFENFNDNASKKDTAIADLENEIQRLKDNQVEERFFWIFSSVILVDMFFFFDADNWAAPLAISALQILLLFIIGQKMGIKSFIAILNKLIDNFGKK